MDPIYPLAPIANFIGCFFVIITLLSLCYRPWNTGVFMFAVYVFLQSLVVGVNAIVWSDNVRDVAPVWCDISEQYRFIYRPLLWRWTVSIAHLYLRRGFHTCLLVSDHSALVQHRSSPKLIDRYEEPARGLFIKVMSVDCIRDLKMQKRNEVLIEFLLCLGLPLLITGLCKLLFKPFSTTTHYTNRLYCTIDKI